MTTRAENINQQLTPLTFRRYDQLFLTAPRGSERYRRIEVYQSKMGALQKVWIRTPILKTAYQSRLQVFDPKIPSLSLRVMLGPLVDEVKKLHQLIQGIEKHIQAKMAEEHPDLTFYPSIIQEEMYYPLWRIKLPVIRSEKKEGCELGFHIYNHSHQRIRLPKLESGVRVAMYLELKEVWLTETQCGCLWSVMQMKVYPKLDFAQCLFDDEEVEEVAPEKETGCYHCLHCPNHHLTTYHPTTSLPAYGTPPPVYSTAPPSVYSTTPTANSATRSSLPPRPMAPRFNPQDLLAARHKLKSAETSVVEKPAPPARFAISLGDLMQAKKNLKSTHLEESEEEGPVDEADQVEVEEIKQVSEVVEEAVEEAVEEVKEVAPEEANEGDPTSSPSVPQSVLLRQNKKLLKKHRRQCRHASREQEALLEEYQQLLQSGHLQLLGRSD